MTGTAVSVLGTLSADSFDNTISPGDPWKSTAGCTLIRAPSALDPRSRGAAVASVIEQERTRTGPFDHPTVHADKSGASNNRAQPPTRISRRSRRRRRGTVELRSLSRAIGSAPLTCLRKRADRRSFTFGTSISDTRGNVESHSTLIKGFG
jgi:hypothetical protein